MDTTQKTPRSDHFDGGANLSSDAGYRSLYTLLVGETREVTLANTAATVFEFPEELAFQRSVELAVLDTGVYREAIVGTDIDKAWSADWRTLTLTNNSGGPLTYHIRVH